MRTGRGGAGSVCNMSGFVSTSPAAAAARARPRRVAVVDDGLSRAGVAHERADARLLVAQSAAVRPGTSPARRARRAARARGGEAQALAARRGGDHDAHARRAGRRVMGFGLVRVELSMPQPQSSSAGRSEAGGGAWRDLALPIRPRQAGFTTLLASQPSSTGARPRGVSQGAWAWLNKQTGPPAPASGGAGARKAERRRRFAGHGSGSRLMPRTRVAAPDGNERPRGPPPRRPTRPAKPPCPPRPPAEAATGPRPPEPIAPGVERMLA